jgi:magnesium transporter
MLRIYSCQNNHLALIDAIPELAEAAPIGWFDLFNPAQDETRSVEQHLGIEIPTRDEMQEIELSDRLYQEDGAEFMTMTAATELDGDNADQGAGHLHPEGRDIGDGPPCRSAPFHLYGARMQRLNGVSCESGELVMLGLLEAMIDRTADALERIGNEIDGISREVFRKAFQAPPRRPATCSR